MLLAVPNFDTGTAVVPSAQALDVTTHSVLRIPPRWRSVRACSHLVRLAVPDACAPTQLFDGLAAGRGGAATRVLACGPKGVGKSTITRLLVNWLLATHKRVVLVDLDVGQPELTPPGPCSRSGCPHSLSSLTQCCSLRALICAGMVALHVLTSPLLGPPHTHLMQPSAAYYVGAVSPKDDPPLYVAAGRALAMDLAEREDCAGVCGTHAPPCLSPLP